MRDGATNGTLARRRCLFVDRFGGSSYSFVAERDSCRGRSHGQQLVVCLALDALELE